MNTKPWHLLPIAVIALIWHLVGAADYVLTQISYEPYLAMLSPEQLTYVQGLPLWVDAAWAVGVWAGLVGAILLLGSERMAVIPLALSMVGLIAGAVWLVFLSEPKVVDVVGDWALYVLGASAALSVFLYLYARTQRQRGVLH